MPPNMAPGAPQPPQYPPAPPYGAPGGFAPQPPMMPVSNKARNAMIMGIVALSTFVLMFVFNNSALTLICWLASLVCSIVGVVMSVGARKERNPQTAGQATAGLVLSIIALVLNALMLLACIVAIGFAGYALSELGDYYMIRAAL